MEEEEGEYPMYDDDFHNPEEEYEPSEQEIAEYCEWLGMDPDSDKQLTWIAREALKAPLPTNWKICYTEDREVYYFNVRTGESIWDHPMDSYYKDLFRQEKEKLEKKRRKMRLYSGSFPILPLPEFFSQLAEQSAGALEIPEYLTDPIDLCLYVDPVVLPTSGRTVSRHTIVNNRWQDPFTREYIENRRLIPNVDKRNEVATWLGKAAAQHIQTIISASTLDPLLKVLPYLLDKEDEVSLTCQNTIFAFLQRLLATPVDSSCSSAGGSATAALAESTISTNPKDTPLSGRRPVNGRRPGKNTPRNQNSPPPTGPPPPGPQTTDGGKAAAASVGYHLLVRLSEEEAGVLIGCLLTMSTTTALEALYLVLDTVPQLRCCGVLRGFCPDVLNVLHLAPADLVQLVVAASPTQNESDEYEETTGPNPQRPHFTSMRATNGDMIVQLKWVLLVMDYPHHLNVLEKLEWEFGVAIVVLLINSVPEVSRERITLVCRLLRGMNGWPNNLKVASDTLLRWMIELVAQDTNPWNQILLVYDLLVNGRDVAIEAIKRKKSVIITSLFAATASDSGQGVTYASMLGALLVFHDCCKLSEFAANPLLQLSIANDLLPRLTRQQWKPKHFEQTVGAIIQAVVKADVGAAWGVMRSRGVAFLLKELSKKKKNSEELRDKLDAIDTAERKWQATNATVNWALFYVKSQIACLSKKSEIESRRAASEDGRRYTQEALHSLQSLAQRIEKKKNLIHGERVANFITALHTLLGVRLKPKQPRPVEGAPQAPAGKDPLAGSTNGKEKTAQADIDDSPPMAEKGKVREKPRVPRESNVPPLPLNGSSSGIIRRRGGREREGLPNDSIGSSSSARGGYSARDNRRDNNQSGFLPPIV
eukprot:TRINITY_DN1715_c0_g1_i1.p1 TRINITY_DN1715_c0_g1~~TRINITY_DN1715_c0_g1_i1.p1  ORF type:complete len:876 (+),score=136.43 TRINITY_DN1715_c0_g1_i1:50-2677(+)